MYYIPIKINGYDQSIYHVANGVNPIIGILWIFIYSLSLIIISKTLRDTKIRTFRFKVMFEKLFQKGTVQNVGAFSADLRSRNQQE
uniref:ABC transporter ATP-binding protein n=1 Tax=Strongyloides venezuelensis TaxID=75913 RepID=A0A0K0F3B3_STRVS